MDEKLTPKNKLAPDENGITLADNHDTNLILKGIIQGKIDDTMKFIGKTNIGDKVDVPHERDHIFEKCIYEGKGYTMKLNDDESKSHCDIIIKIEGGIDSNEKQRINIINNTKVNSLNDNIKLSMNENDKNSNNFELKHDIKKCLDNEISKGIPYIELDNQHHLIHMKKHNSSGTSYSKQSSSDDYDYIDAYSRIKFVFEDEDESNDSTRIINSKAKYILDIETKKSNSEDKFLEMNKCEEEGKSKKKNMNIKEKEKSLTNKNIEEKKEAFKDDHIDNNNNNNAECLLMIGEIENNSHHHLNDKKETENNIVLEDSIEKKKRRSNLNSMPLYASSPIITDFKNAEIYADGHETKIPNLDLKIIMANSSKCCGASSNSGGVGVGGSGGGGGGDYNLNNNPNNANSSTTIIGSPKKLSVEFPSLAFESETHFSTPRIETSETNLECLSVQNPQAISSNSSFILDDTNPNLLRDCIWSQTPTKKNSRLSKYNPILSALSNETSMDNENSMINSGRYALNFNGKNHKNSPRIDYESPFGSESSNNNNYIQEELLSKLRKINLNEHLDALNSQNDGNTIGISTQTFQKIFPNPPVSLNQNYIDFLSRNNTTSDLNSSLSSSHDDQTIIINNYNTPREGSEHHMRYNNKPNNHYIQQDYHQHHNMDLYYHKNIQDNGIISQKISDITPENTYYNHLSKSYNNHYGNKSKSMMNTPNGLSHRFNDDRFENRKNSHHQQNSNNNNNNNNSDDFYSTYDIDVNKLDDPNRTTLMIKNIPNKYDRNLILQTIDKNHKRTYDFFYLPIDFRNCCNVGYAFINFIDSKFIKPFYNEFNGKRWEKFNSEKICVLKYARIQGRESLIQHFQFSSVMNQQDKKLKPLILPNHRLSSIKQLVKMQPKPLPLPSASNLCLVSPSSPAYPLSLPTSFYIPSIPAFPLSLTVYLLHLLLLSTLFSNRKTKTVIIYKSLS